MAKSTDASLVVSREKVTVVRKDSVSHAKNGFSIFKRLSEKRLKYKIS